MSTKTDFDYLRDMLSYAEDGQTLAEGRKREDLDTDLEFRYALQYCLLIVGEAAGKVSEGTRNRLPNIPWRAITGMRNWLVHGYERIRAQTIWDTVVRDLPQLIEEVLKYLPPEQT